MTLLADSGVTGWMIQTASQSLIITAINHSHESPHCQSTSNNAMCLPDSAAGREKWCAVDGACMVVVADINRRTFSWKSISTPPSWGQSSYGVCNPYYTDDFWSINCYRSHSLLRREKFRDKKTLLFAWDAYTQAYSADSSLTAQLWLVISICEKAYHSRNAYITFIRSEAIQIGARIYGYLIWTTFWILHRSRHFWNSIGIWNSIPAYLTSISLLTIFWQRIKTFLAVICYFDVCPFVGP